VGGPPGGEDGTGSKEGPAADESLGSRWPATGQGTWVEGEPISMNRSERMSSLDYPIRQGHFGKVSEEVG
jgi:hypothetical protein